jgi:hypothetical protein
MQDSQQVIEQGLLVRSHVIPRVRPLSFVMFAESAQCHPTRGRPSVVQTVRTCDS